jgi:isopenicillin N synthase-like dioxygenase
MDHPNSHSLASSVKTVDFGPFLDGSDKQGVANAILDSFKSIGFVYLVNHSLDDANIASMFKWVRFNIFHSHILLRSHCSLRSSSRNRWRSSNWRLTQFPELITEVSLGSLLQIRSSIHSTLRDVGYSAPGREKVIQFDDEGGDNRTDIVRDIKESFEAGREDDHEMPNIWYPDGILPGFKEACLDFYWVR